MPEDDARQEAIVACERLGVAMRRVGEVFAEEHVYIDHLLAALKGPGTLTEKLAHFDLSTERTSMMATLDEFETARREARLAAWVLMASEGCSIGEMGRIFGLSRQLISRQLRDRLSVEPL